MSIAGGAGAEAFATGSAGGVSVGGGEHAASAKIGIQRIVALDHLTALERVEQQTEVRPGVGFFDAEDLGLAGRTFVGAEEPVEVGSQVCIVAGVATMADLDELALALPEATKELSEDGRPAYRVHGKLFCCQRGRRADALDPETGERLDDVLMFRVADLDVKDLLLADARGIFFTTSHFDGYSAVLVRIPQLERLDHEELGDLVAEAWLTRAQKRVAKAWLAEHSRP